MLQFVKFLSAAWRYRELLTLLLPLVKEVIEAIKDDDDDDDEKKKPALPPTASQPLAEIIQQYKRKPK
jgi:hypothetical protein